MLPVFHDGLGDPNPNNDVLVSFVQLNNNDLELQVC